MSTASHECRLPTLPTRTLSCMGRPLSAGTLRCTARRGFDSLSLHWHVYHLLHCPRPNAMGQPAGCLLSNSSQPDCGSLGCLVPDEFVPAVLYSGHVYLREHFMKHVVMLCVVFLMTSCSLESDVINEPESVANTLGTRTPLSRPSAPRTATTHTPTPIATTTTGTAPSTPLPSSTKTPTVIAPSISYTVEPGDTLRSIAVQFNTTIDQLVEVNNLRDANLIRVGEVLQIHESTATATAAPTLTIYANCAEAEAAGEFRTLGSIGTGIGFPAEQIPSAPNGDGDNKTCEIEPTSTPEPVSTASAAPQVVIELGGEPVPWAHGTRTDSFTDTVSYTTSVTSFGSVESNAQYWRSGQRALFIVNCHVSKSKTTTLGLSILLGKHAIIFGNLNDFAKVEYRFDGREGQEAHWKVSTSHQAVGLIGDSAWRFLQLVLQEGTYFIFRATDWHDGTRYSMLFDMRGVEEMDHPLREVLRSCGRNV